MKEGNTTKGKGLVTIVMPAYNSEKHIEQSIDSVITQTYENWELIVIDDFSNDKTVEKVQNYHDKRIKLIKLDKNSGVANARNVGIRKATGEFTAFLDSDDLWKPTKLEKQVAFYNKEDPALVFTEYAVVNENGFYKKEITDQPLSVDYQGLLHSNVIGLLTVFLKTEVIQRNLMPNMPHEDYATWLKVLKSENKKAFLIPEVLSCYRTSDHSLSANKFKAAIWTWRVLIEQEKVPKFAALKLMFSYTLRALKKHI